MLTLLAHTLKNHNCDGNTSVYYQKNTADPAKSTWKLGCSSPFQRFCAWMKGDTSNDVQKVIISAETRNEFIKELESKYGATIVDTVFKDNGINRIDGTPLKVRHVIAASAGCKTLSEKNYAALSKTIKEKIENKSGLVARAITVLSNHGMSQVASKLIYQPDFNASLRDHFDNLLERKKAEATCSGKGSATYMEELVNNPSAFDALMIDAVNACFESRKNVLDSKFSEISKHVPNIQYSDDPIEMIRTHLTSLETSQQIGTNTAAVLKQFLNRYKSFIEAATTPVCTLNEIADQIEILQNVQASLVRAKKTISNGDGITKSIVDGCYNFANHIGNQIQSLENLKKTAADSQAVVHQQAEIAYRTGILILTRQSDSALSPDQVDKFQTAIAKLINKANLAAASSASAQQKNQVRDADTKLRFEKIEREVEKIIKDTLKGTPGEKIDYWSTYRNVRLELMEATGFNTMTHTYTFQKNDEVKRYTNTLTPANEILVVSKNYMDTNGARISCRASGHRGEGGGHAINMWSSVLKDEQSQKTVFKGIKHAICCAFRIDDNAKRAEENKGMVKEILEAGIGIDGDFQQRAIANSNDPTKSNIKNRQLVISCALTSPHFLTYVNTDNAERKMTDEQQAAFDSFNGQVQKVDIPDGNNSKQIDVDVSVIQFCFGTNGFATTAVVRDSTWAHVAAKNHRNMIKLFGNTKAGTPSRGETGQILSELQAAYNKPGMSDDKKKQIVELTAEITQYADTARKIYETEDYKKNDGDAYKMSRTIGLLANALGKAGEFVDTLNLTVTNASGCKSACDRGGNNMIIMIAATVMKAFGSIWRPGKELSDTDKNIVTSVAMGPETNHSNAANRSVGAAKSAVQIKQLLAGGEETMLQLAGYGIDLQTWS